ncbi:Zn-ribbon domain-containing protein [Candidatus Woesearchaeota archaeon]|nr:Zn-ribbon domain-containing protein [Candidatus Woesearchaeota archaeon]MBW2978642.1 Zn-ribbon domain-containing protein [Candidatus Woesearchaeota archaeon]
MPHQCVRCNKFYDDGAEEIIKGCSCGGRLFFFVKASKLKDNKQPDIAASLSVEEKHRIQEDVFELANIKERDAPVVLELESVNVKQPGKFELDLVRLFKGDPLIFRLQEGKYIIDVAETFRRMRKK